MTSFLLPLLTWILSAASPGPASVVPLVEPRFVIVALGTSGGLAEDDLSAYLAAPVGDARFVALDAGTLRVGLDRAVSRGAFPDVEIPEGLDRTTSSWILRRHVLAYLISHPHLDHFAGLVLNSPDDAAGKLLVGTAPTLDALRSHVFNGRIWANFTTEGEGAIGLYRPVLLTPEEPRALEGTAWRVEALPLAHGGGPSTAFLLESGGAQLVYFGDTGADEVEGSDLLGRAWDRLAPLVRSGTLRGLFLEASYPSERPDDRLHGHLTPRWLLVELRRLAERVDAEHPESALAGLTVLVTHIKPEGPDPEANRERMRGEIEAADDLGARFLFPRSGDRIEL